MKRHRLDIQIGKADGIWSVTIAALRVCVHVDVIQGLEGIFSYGGNVDRHVSHTLGVNQRNKFPPLIG